MTRLMTGATAIIVLLCCTTASAAPRDEEVFRLPLQLEGRARIVKVQAPRTADPNAEARDGLAEWEAPTHPADIVVEVINDEAVARGVTATGPGIEAVVFSQMLDSGYGFFLDNTPGTVQWHRMIPGLGFQPSSDTLSSFVARVYTSADSIRSFDGTGGFTLELWDGDPLGVHDITCSAGGVPAPIPGTTCSWTDLPEGVVYDLKCIFPAKVTLNCDRVFGVVWSDDLCRWAWRLSEGFISGGSETSPTVGAGDALGIMYACEQYGHCATPSGYNAGFCCEDQGGDPGTVACDHTATCDGDPGTCSNRAGGCTVDSDCWTPIGGCNPTGATSDATFCQDDAADYFHVFADEAPVYYNNFVGQLSARTELIMQVVPMSVDAIPTAASPGFVTIDGNTVTIDQAYPGGERHLWFEIYVSDWDPADAGLTVKAWHVGLDASGYSAGLACTLTPWRPACTTDADCEAVQGPVGGPLGALKGGCNLPGIPPGVCAAGFADGQRSDFIFRTTNYFGGVDQSTLDYRYGATKSGSGMVSPHIGDMYLGTLTLKTMCDCPAGNFSVGMKLPNMGACLVDGDSQFIPLLGVRGADIIFPMGQCCNLSVYPTVCISDTVTRCECERMGIDGGFYVNFDPTKTCADQCCDCLTGDHGVCADGDACTVNRCVNCFCETTPVSVGLDECCDPTCIFANATDIEGLGAIASNDDGNQCTANLCDDPGECGVGDQCGVPDNPPLAAGEECYDGEPCQTVNDQCDGAGNCVGTDILTIDCTDDWTCELLGVGARCNLVVGKCFCVFPSLNFDIHPSQKPNDACFLVGEPVVVDVYFMDVPVVVNGGQFVVNYDPACLDFVSIVPAGDPYTFEISEMVDEATGTIFYAVGVDPFGGNGNIINGIIATITFTKIGVCETCNMCFGSANPLNSYLVDDRGQVVFDMETHCSDDIFPNDIVTIDVPDDIVMNINSCDSDTAFVYWDPPTATSMCDDAYLVCTGPWAPGDPHYVDPMTGGEIPVGTWEFSCTAASDVCGDLDEDGWVVTVNDEVTLDVTLQVSPVMAVSEEIIRCIKFELFSDCVQDPLVFEREVVLGGMWDYYPHFTEAIKVPADGNWICITARDQLHTLRGCDYLVCEDGVYTATFKGDPFFGGNWLIGGNLDGFKKDIPSASHDVIDILDFGQFVAQFAANYGTGDTPCGTQGPNADINGDGVVSVLDFTFVTMNFLASSKECCCGGAVAGAATTEISVEELRANGLGDLSIGDLNRDGVLDAADMTDFMNGVRPSKKSSHDRTDSSLR